jgi:hypothetical protein
MRGLLVGVAAAAALAVAAPAARADDASLKAAVQAEQPQFASALGKFEKAAKHLGTRKGIDKAKIATARLRNATQEYYNGVSVQQASTQEFADARQHLLIGLVRYKEGLVLYRKALISLTHRHASQAKNRVKLAVRRFKTAGKEFLKAQVLVQ